MDYNLWFRSVVKRKLDGSIGIVREFYGVTVKVQFPDLAYPVLLNLDDVQLANAEEKALAILAGL